MGAELWWGITTVAGLAIGIIGYFLKRTISKTDEHDKDINTIKQTYVTQDDFKSYKNESRDDIQQLAGDLSELKEKCLFKEDFYRTQAATDKKLDKIYDMLYALSSNGGGKENG